MIHLLNWASNNTLFVSKHWTTPHGVYWIQETKRTLIFTTYAINTEKGYSWYNLFSERWINKVPGRPAPKYLGPIGILGPGLTSPDIFDFQGSASEKGANKFELLEPIIQDVWYRSRNLVK